ncbi:hypothetical protein AAMO2058_001343200 [Amorphochlora amoebiformis]
MPVHHIGQLLDYVNQGDLVGVQKELQKGVHPYVNTKFSVKRDTLLHIACRGGKFAIAQCLIQIAKASLNVLDSNGQHALFSAARGGHVDIVRYLLEKGAKPTLKDFHGETPLMHAVLSGSYNTVKVIIRRLTIVDINEKNNRGENALLYASRLGHLGVLRNLVEVERATVDFTQPLVATAKLYEHSAVTDYLVSAKEMKAKHILKRDLPKGVRPMYQEVFLAMGISSEEAFLKAPSPRAGRSNAFTGIARQPASPISPFASMSLKRPDSPMESIDLGSGTKSISSPVKSIDGRHGRRVMSMEDVINL